MVVSARVWVLEERRLTIYEVRPKGDGQRRGGVDVSVSGGE